MEQLIDIIIPCRNRGGERLQLCLNYLNPINNKLIGKIYLVDYKSKTPLDYENDVPQNMEKFVKIIRCESYIFNKAHAINIGFKHSKSDYIMLIDADILLGPDFFNKIEPLINSDNFIYSNKVKRISKEDLTDNWKKNLGLSKKWGEEYNVMQEVHNTATGGFQIFPRKFFEDIRGLDENLIYYGGMDNITLIEAKRYGLNVISLNETILHLEHPHLKEDNLPEEERDFARYVRSDRYNLMNQILDLCHDKNPGFYGELDGPNDYLIDQYVNSYKLLKQRMIKEEENSFELPQNTKIMIAVINNRDTLPERFVQSLMGLFHYTHKIFPNTEIHYFKHCQVNMMRNMSVMKAIDLKFDYLVQLDEDHIYGEDFIIKMIGRNKDFMTGCTRRRTKPYKPTQYYKFKFPLMSEDNFVYTNGRDGLVKIEASGPVGMLMKVSALKKLNYPYYWIDYSYYQMGLNRSKTEEWTFYPVKRPTPLGGDYQFCLSILEKGMEIWLDTSIEFPHFIQGEVSGLGTEQDNKEEVLTLD